MDAAYGLRLRRKSYRTTAESVVGDEISELTATRDLKSMVDHGLLEPIGERRGRYYVAADQLKEVRGRIRRGRPARAGEDPFQVAQERRQMTLA